MDMKTQQMEISLAIRPCRSSTARRQRRQSRARWWFAQMRRVVDAAESAAISPLRASK